MVRNNRLQHLGAIGTAVALTLAASTTGSSAAAPAPAARAPATAAAPLAAPPAQTVAARRPDIVLFIADDFTRTDIGVYGSPDARTPNIDALAKAGLRFTNAFAASPTCTPSRSALMTGDYPIHNGAHPNHAPIKPGIETLPQYLLKLGYRVVLAGKTDFGPRSQFPFEYLGGATVHPPGRKGVLDSILGTEAVDHLLATRDKTKPLALIVTDYASHVPWPDNAGYAAGRLTLAANFYDTPETREARTRYLTKVTLADIDVGAVRASIAKYGGTDHTLFLFTADQGALFPFGKWNLYDDGIATPLIASWPGHVPAGKSTDALVSLVDLLPTFQQVAGGAAATGIDGRSLLPVLLGRSNVAHQEVYAAHTGERGVDGPKNIAPMRAIRTAHYKLIENLRPDIPFIDPISYAPDRRDDHYFVGWEQAAKNNVPKAAFLVDHFHHRPPLELYDITTDPHELHNLAGDARYKATVSTLKGKLDAWRVQQGETPGKVIMPEDSLPGHFPYTTCPCTTPGGEPLATAAQLARAGKYPASGRAVGKTKRAVPGDTN